MSRILLADDSPHAQRMGERILRDEGHEVVVVSDGRVALLRLEDSQPDLIIAATGLHHGLTIVSRDIVDYEKTRVPLFNPWMDSLPVS